jgi:hypothetical protein
MIHVDNSHVNQNLSVGATGTPAVPSPAAASGNGDGHTTAGVPLAEAPRPSVPADVASFYGALFEPADLITTRPIETWIEDGIRKSKVLYEAIRHYPAEKWMNDGELWYKAQAYCQEHRANQFYGVCPREGGDGQFELAWQIRTVRVLWADLDNCSVEEALRRCKEAGLPRPSIIVKSGNGVHLYWILAEPYLVDDVGIPPAVLKEFRGRGEKPLQYIASEIGEPIYEFLPGTDKRNPDWPTVSPKGQHVQDVLVGIADLIDGDHTQDLARILRLPSTLNMKDARNDKAPVPCELVECNPDLRYPFAEFERFAKIESTPKDDETASKPAKIKATKAPNTGGFCGPRQHLDSKKAERKFNRQLRACLSPNSDRSSADFALCCAAIEVGYSKEYVWRLIGDYSKFADRGQAYFESTWSKAEIKVRSNSLTTFDKLTSVPVVEPTVTIADKPQPPIAVDATPLQVIKDHSERIIESLNLPKLHKCKRWVSFINDDAHGGLACRKPCGCWDCDSCREDLIYGNCGKATAKFLDAEQNESVIYRLQYTAEEEEKIHKRIMRRRPRLYQPVRLAPIPAGSTFLLVDGKLHAQFVDGDGCSVTRRLTSVCR